MLIMECGTCTHYDGSRCTKDWNNLDEAYYIPERDDKKHSEWCDDYEWDEDDFDFGVELTGK